MSQAKIIWWNVQRLFHPSNSKLSRELDATNANGWTRAAYKKKVRNIALVIKSLTGGEVPALLGLSEVESSQVVDDLLKELGWSDLVEAKGTDSRLDGYDTTLLYSQKYFKNVSKPISHTVNNRFATRDIFEVDLKTHSNESLKVLANHWPSRLWTGSAGLRVALGDYCYRLVTNAMKIPKASLLTKNGNPKIPPRKSMEKRWNSPVIVMGDFNDGPFDYSVAQMMNCSRNLKKVAAHPRLPKKKNFASLKKYLSLDSRLYNPCWDLLVPSAKSPGGTLYWNSEWYLLDQIMFSPGLLVSNKIKYVEGSLHVGTVINVTNKNGDVIPIRTAKGYPREFDTKKGIGASDHLPLVCELEIK